MIFTNYVLIMHFSRIYVILGRKIQMILNNYTNQNWQKKDG